MLGFLHILFCACYQLIQDGIHSSVLGFLVATFCWSRPAGCNCPGCNHDRDFRFCYVVPKMLVFPLCWSDVSLYNAGHSTPIGELKDVSFNSAMYIADWWESFMESSLWDNMCEIIHGCMINPWRWIKTIACFKQILFEMSTHQKWRTI